jgi:hypothetical protein
VREREREVDENGERVEWETLRPSEESDKEEQENEAN